MCIRDSGHREYERMCAMQELAEWLAEISWEDEDKVSSLLSSQLGEHIRLSLQGLGEQQEQQKATSSVPAAKVAPPVKMRRWSSCYIDV
eukprot:7369923-Prymnesium_polylepis.1